MGARIRTGLTSFRIHLQRIRTLAPFIIIDGFLMLPLFVPIIPIDFGTTLICFLFLQDPMLWMSYSMRQCHVCAVSQSVMIRIAMVMVVMRMVTAFVMIGIPTSTSP